MNQTSSSGNWFRKVTGWLRPQWHPALLANHAHFAEFDQDGPLDDYSFVFVDTELTGLNTRQDDIVSIGAVRSNGLSINPSDSYYAVVRPQAEMGKPATLVHRITPSSVADKPTVDAILPEFVEWCGDSLLVGHNVALDMAFLGRAAKQTLGGRLATPCIDTMRLAQTWEEEQWADSFDPFMPQVSFALSDLAKRYDLPRFEAHNALQDALQAAYLFVYLARKLKGGNVSTLRDLYMVGRSWRWYF